MNGKERAKERIKKERRMVITPRKSLNCALIVLDAVAGFNVTYKIPLKPLAALFPRPADVL